MRDASEHSLKGRHHEKVNTLDQMDLVEVNRERALLLRAWSVRATSTEPTPNYLAVPFRGPAELVLRELGCSPSSLTISPTLSLMSLIYLDILKELCYT